MENTAKKNLHIIKKYPNRRLYDTHTSGYITLSEIKRFIIEGHDLKVLDSKTNEDLTHNILLQVILDKENNKMPLLSSEMLMQMIKFYDHPMQRILSAYLEKNIQFFIEAQKELAKTLAIVATQATQQSKVPALENIMSRYIAENRILLARMQVELEKEVEEYGVSAPAD